MKSLLHARAQAVESLGRTHQALNLLGEVGLWAPCGLFKHRSIRPRFIRQIGVEKKLHQTPFFS